MEDSNALVLLILLFVIFRLFSRPKNKSSAAQNVKQPVQPVTVSAVRVEKKPEPAEGEGYSVLRQEHNPLPFSGEGEDQCDPALGHQRVVDLESVYAHEITDEGNKLDLSAQGVWQGVVMSEVLARPAAARNHGWKRK